MSNLRDLIKRAEKIPGLAPIVADWLRDIVREAEQADREYEKTHWGDLPDGAELVELPRIRPGDVVVALGTLEEVAYRATKAGEDVIWVHAFGRRKPVLAYTPDGRLVIVGGGYRVTERGIVG